MKEITLIAMHADLQARIEVLERVLAEILAALDGDERPESSIKVVNDKDNNGEGK